MMRLIIELMLPLTTVTQPAFIDLIKGLVRKPIFQRNSFTIFFSKEPNAKVMGIKKLKRLVSTAVKNFKQNLNTKLAGEDSVAEVAVAVESGSFFNFVYLR